MHLLISLVYSYPGGLHSSPVYDAYVSLLVSGTSEAFMHAVATESQLKRSNDSLLVFSLISVVLNVLLIRLYGSVGLIMANSLSILSTCVPILTVAYFMLFTVFFPYGNHKDAQTHQLLFMAQC